MDAIHVKTNLSSLSIHYETLKQQKLSFVSSLYKINLLHMKVNLEVEQVHTNTGLA